MHHAKTDSEVTSFAPSSPASRPAYYVQSPSRDSHDGEKTGTTASFHSTPVLSPSGSPPHSSSSVGRHSRESSTSRFSGHHHGRKVSPADRKGGDGKKDFDAIEEEGLLDDDGGGYPRSAIPRRCYFPLFLLAFLALFFFFALILWGASRSQTPHIVLNSITFEHFNIQAGTDASGVPTDMASLNATVKMTYRNAGTFFGVHVGGSSVDLAYSQLTLGNADIKEFYQRRKSQRSLSVAVIGIRIPLYGAGASLSPAAAAKGVSAAAAPPVPLTLSVAVRSRAHVLGELVKPRFYNGARCAVVLDHAKLGKPVSLAKACKYD